MHIAATLFAVASKNQEDGPSATSIPCKWIQPPKSALKKVEYKRGADIFKKVSNDATTTKTSPTEEEKKVFYESLLHSENQEEKPCKAAILSVTPGYSHRYIPRQMTQDLPPDLTLLYDPACLKKPLNELQEKSKVFFDSMSVTDHQAQNVEHSTKAQSSCKLWHSMRAGRITASNFKAACRTSTSTPSESLIKKICYTSSIQTLATKYGCDHEKEAVQSYSNLMSSSHVNFNSSDSGLHLNPQYPFLGASPDGHVSCDCCGSGIVEVKCPFCLEKNSFEDATSKKDFCLESDYSLKKEHAYYYQVQAQLFVCNVNYCDFVVWRSPQDFVIQRIHADQEFFNHSVKEAKAFYVQCILPELFGKWFTVTRHSRSSTSHGYCYCGSTDTERDIIECMSGICKIVKFHRTCLKISNTRKAWKCPTCVKVLNKAKREKQKFANLKKK